MTNAIEQAKREMYNRLSNLKSGLSEAHLGMNLFELDLEKYLELLRQDHEALHETARKRFEDLQMAEAANQELQKKNKYWRDLNANQRNTIEEMQERLAKMTEERDSIQLRLHAVDHAYKTQQDRMAIPIQDSGDRASCETPDAKTGVYIAIIKDVQRSVDKWAEGTDKAKKTMLEIAGVVNGLESYSAMASTKNPATCMHSFFAIGDDQMKCTFCGVGK